MVKAILGRKLRMTQMFSEDGRRVPLTAIAVGPCPIVQIKTEENDGYKALQVGFDAIKEKSSNKPMIGHYKKGKTTPHRTLREIRVDSTDEYSVGGFLEISAFEEGDIVDVTGTVKGRGFQGGMKRYNWSGGRATHGSMFHRSIGAVSSGTNQGRVFKGKTLPGHMGNNRVTLQNIKIEKIDSDNKIIYIQGGIPGPNGGVVFLKGATKNHKKK